MSDLLTAVAIFMMVAGLSYLAALAISHLVEQHLHMSEGVDRVDERFQEANILFRRFEDRGGKIMPRVARLDNELKSARRQNYMSTRRVADLEAKRDQLIRVLGEEDAFTRPGRPARHFVAAVINRHVQRAVMEQKEVMGLSRSWARTQNVHAWAPNASDAKTLVESYYPHSMGFHIIEIREPSQDSPGDHGPGMDEGDVHLAETDVSTPQG
ncbi:hypothetical protein [Nitrospirillum sp. BR 11163]|uniref:hypothetical protein n=1 Tax=Nitrospirillum sp. BR 11163 TaxID=3104323 RepID=UPI002AFF4D92|nr:hypothetical protein [Nitrospirillum sp. BR 11163]MEA1676913.1 hypothetical protein [Nitrospirillum sp. BR 11163]